MSDEQRHAAVARRPPYRELTFAAVSLGIVQGIVQKLTFVYAVFKLGFRPGGSTVASIMGYGLPRGVPGKGTMIENNINQTITSGINPAGTGGVFTLPTRFMLDAKWRADGHLPEAIASREEGTEAFVEAHKMVPNG